MVFTNNETLVNQVEIGARFDDSYHHEIRFKINAKREVEQNTASVPDFREANYQLHSIDWEIIRVDREEDQGIEVKLYYNNIVRKNHTGQEQYIPNRNYPKWMNSRGGQSDSEVRLSD